MSKLNVVTFRAFGREIPALVLAGRDGEVSHLGSSGEPMLTLAMIDPARETGLSKDAAGNFVYPIGRIPQIFIEHDVVHASHEFSADFKKDKAISSPAQIASIRGNGEWTEYAGDAGELIDSLRSSLASAQKAVKLSVAESRKQAARADQAEAERDAARKEVAAGKAAQPAPSAPPV